MARAHNFFILIATLIMTGLFAAGCDSGTQEPEAPAAEPLQLENAGAAATPEGSFPASRYPAEMAEGTSASVPDTFPKNIPLYPGSAPAQGRGVDIEGAPMAALQLLTMDPPETVYDFYREKFQSDGWEIEDRENFRGKNAISASNGKCKASILVAPTDDGGSDIFMITEC